MYVKHEKRVRSNADVIYMVFSLPNTIITKLSAS